MMSETAVRWSGLLMIGGAVLLAAGIVTLSMEPVINQVFSPRVSWLLLVAAILLLISLPGMYIRQADSAGWAGLAGFVLLQTGIVLLVVAAAPALLYPSIHEPAGESMVAFVLGISLTIGLLLTGFATLRAGVYARWSGILILAATAGFFFVFFVAEFLPPAAGQLGSGAFGLLLALALAWIGYATLTAH